MIFPIVNVTTNPLPSEINWNNFPFIKLPIYVIATCHYIILLISMRKTAKTSSFYKIFFFSGISCVIHCFCIFWLTIANRCFIGPATYPITKICNILDYILFCSNALTSVLLCLNRFSGTFVSYKKFWSNRLINLYLLIIFLLSVAESLPYALSTKIFYVENGKWHKTNSYNFNPIAKPLDAAVIVITELISLILIIWTYYRLKSGNKKFGNLEINLLLVAILHFFIDLAILLGEFEQLWSSKDVTSFLEANVLTSIFIITVCDSFTIIATNGKIRKQYFATLMFWKKNGQVGPQVILVSSSPKINDAQQFFP